MSSLSYLSSRGGAPPVALSEAIRQGLAPDGGLYVPSRLPRVEVASLAGLSTLPDIARSALGGFFEGDPLQPHLKQIADAALDIDAPTTRVEGCAERLFALELFHGPTAAFKDFGARFLAESLERLEALGAEYAPLV
jgi:threonine synthase